MEGLIALRVLCIGQLVIEIGGDHERRGRELMAMVIRWRSSAAGSGTKRLWSCTR